jgi:hypothetical protein
MGALAFCFTSIPLNFPSLPLPPTLIFDTRLVDTRHLWPRIEWPRNGRRMMDIEISRRGQKKGCRQLVFRGMVDVIDNDVFDRAVLGIEFQTQLILESFKESGRRVVGGGFLAEWHLR